MRDRNAVLDGVGVCMSWRLALWASGVVVVAFTGCTKPQGGDQPADTATTEAEAAKTEGASDEHHAHTEGKPHAEAKPHADVAAAVSFIQASASVRQNAARECRQMYLCTYFKPANRGGEQGMITSAPEDAKDCLVSRNPECEAALEQVAKLSPPKSIRVDYMQWAHNADALEHQASEMALELLEQKKLKVKKEGDGYQDFWTVWAAEHFPSQSSKALDMNARAEVMRSEGEKGLASWLTKHEVCSEGTPCTPMAVEKGEGLRD